MPRAPSYVTDYRQFEGSLSPQSSPPARRFATFLHELVSIATRKGVGTWKTSVRCFQRLSKRACVGGVVARLRRGHEEIAWECPLCGASGIIRNWKGSMTAPSPAPAVPRIDYRAMADAVTASAESEADEARGWCQAIAKHLRLPFETKVLGVDVRVESVGQLPDGALVAVCRRGQGAQSVPILDLPLPRPPPEGSVWLDAYRLWWLG
jgi:hypothetical protein